MEQLIDGKMVKAHVEVKSHVFPHIKYLIHSFEPHSLLGLSVTSVAVRRGTGVGLFCVMLDVDLCTHVMYRQL